MVEETFYAHRLHQSLFIQSIEVINSGKVPIHAQLSLSTKSDAETQLATKIDSILDGVKVLSVHGVKESEYELVNFTTVLSNFQTLVHIPQQSRNKVDVLSITKFLIIPLMNKSRNRKSVSLDTAVNPLQKEALDLLTSVLNMKAETLLEQHLKGWSEIWKVSLYIFIIV